MAFVYIEGELLACPTRCKFAVSGETLHACVWVSWLQGDADCAAVIEKCRSSALVRMRVLMAGCGESWVADGRVGRAEVTSGDNKTELYFEFAGELLP